MAVHPDTATRRKAVEWETLSTASGHDIHVKAPHQQSSEAPEATQPDTHPRLIDGQCGRNAAFMLLTLKDFSALLQAT